MYAEKKPLSVLANGKKGTTVKSLDSSSNVSAEPYWGCHKLSTLELYFRANVKLDIKLH